MRSFSLKNIHLLHKTKKPKKNQIKTEPKKKKEKPKPKKLIKYGIFGF